MRPILPSIALVTVVAHSKTTWTVNSAGGAQFTTIQAAAAAASDGDTILVAPASSSYSIDCTLSKGIAIVGDGGAPIVNGQLTIANIAAPRAVAVRNLTSGPLTTFRLAVTDCTGAVHCEALALWGYQYGAGGTITSHPAIAVQNAAGVTLNLCSGLGWPAISATDSDLAATDTELRGIGNDPVTGTPLPGEAIAANGCRIALTSCLLRGGSGHIHFPADGANAVTATGSELLAAATDFVGGSVPYPPNVHGSSVVLDAASSLVHDAACTFPDGIGGAGTVGQREMCRLAGSAAAPGSTASFTATGPAGSVAIVVAALPSAPFAVPPFGLVWLDLQTASVMQVGTMPLPPAQVPTPSGTQRGLAYALQGVLSYGSTVQLSPPLTTVVP